MTNKLSGLIAGLGLITLFAEPAPAAPSPALLGHIPTAVKRLNLQPVGSLPPATILHLHIGLPLRNQDDFTNTLAQLYNPASPQYHHWLTPDQIATNYGPTEQDYQAVIAFAKSNHLQLTQACADHTLVGISGSSADIENMLHVKMLLYQHPRENRTFYAPDSEPSPDSPAPLLHITGLDNFTIPKPATNYAGSGTNGGYWGYDFRHAYAPGVYQTGAGQTVGIYSHQLYFSNDIADYRASTGIPAVTLENVVADPDFNPPLTNGSGGEITVDIEMANAMAPGLSEIIIYQGNDGLAIYKCMQTNNIAKQLSSSWQVYTDTNYDLVFLMCAMQGQSLFVASGDDGAYSQGNPENFVDDPYVTIVGGTVLSTSSPGGAWAAETNWPGSGGGISSYMDGYSIPGWQQTLSMSLNGGSTIYRNIPDVAMVASGIYNTFGNGQFRTLNNGTSFATPLWAGFMALVNEKAVANGQPTVGFLNPLIYAIGTSPNYTNCFHDITVGSNPTGPQFTTNFPGNVYYATTGYDLCTGWGSPTGSNLINALVGYAGGVYLDFNYTGPSSSGNNGPGSYDYPYNTMAQATNGVSTFGTIIIKTAGSSPETMTIKKPMTINAIGGPAKIGN